VNPITAGQFVQVNEQIKLHYATSGDPSRERCLVMLHGWPEYWQAWQPVMQVIDEFCVAPDLRGFNLSSKPREVKQYKIDLLIQDILSLIAHVKARFGDKQIVLVAHDWGGAVAWSLAANCPKAIDRLVIINSPHPVPFAKALAHDKTQQDASQYMNWLRQPETEARLSEHQFAKLEGFIQHGEDKLPAWFDRAAYHAAWSQTDATNPGHPLTGGLNYYRVTPLRPPLPNEARPPLQLDPAAFRVNMPTLLCWGTGDKALLPILTEGLSELIDDYTYREFEGVSHWVMHEIPEQLAAAISDWLP
jgi:epoxide hydrolase 4